MNYLCVVLVFGWFTFAVLTISWRLVWIRSICIDRIHLSCVFSVSYLVFCCFSYNFRVFFFVVMESCRIDLFLVDAILV